MSKPATIADTFPSAASSRRALSFSVGSMAFALTTVAGVLITLLTVSLSQTTIVSLITITLLYVVFGTVGFERVNTSRQPRLIATYLMVQIALAGAAIYFCRAGSIWLIIMPLVSHSVLLLPLSLSATFAVVVTLLFAGSDLLRHMPDKIAWVIWIALA